jgi:iron transport multicopper oxidase
VGGSASAPFQLTAAQGATVTALSSTSAEFTTSNVTPPLPATLAPGGTLSGTVTFQPTTTGLRTGALVATAGGVYALALSGTGQVSGANVQASPASVTFEPTTPGQVSIHAVTFQNVGDAAFPVTSAGVRGPPFSVTGGPGSGFSLAPGQSVTISVTFAPTTGGPAQDTLTLASGAASVAVPLSGMGVGPGLLVVNPLELDFGVVQIGANQTQSFTLANTGGQRLTITRSKPPATGVGFTGTPLPEGTSLAPGESMAVNVTFAPTSPGPQTDQWSLNSDVGGADGGQNVVLKGTGAGTPTDAGTGTDGGTGGGASSSGGCTAAAGTSLWPLLLLVAWLARPRKPEGSRA